MKQTDLYFHLFDILALPFYSDEELTEEELFHFPDPITSNGTK